MKALIFGANGQCGHYLGELLEGKGFQVIATSRSSLNASCDVRERAGVEELIRQYQPSLVFHLAANSTTRHHALFENHETISTGSLNILESVKQFSPSSKVFLTGSGLQFHNTGAPIRESDPFDAGSAYALARISSVYAARYYRSIGIATYVGYLFHHESPLRKPGHVSQIVAQAALEISQGRLESFEIGDISVEKEWTFARDVVNGIWTLVDQDEVFEATIGSGVTHSIREWLEMCFQKFGLNWQDYVTIARNFQAEYPKLVSNPETINSLGWKATTPLDELASIMTASRE